jgi:hypothetical protein
MMRLSAATTRLLVDAGLARLLAREDSIFEVSGVLAGDADGPAKGSAIAMFKWLVAAGELTVEIVSSSQVSMLSSSAPIM